MPNMGTNHLRLFTKYLNVIRQTAEAYLEQGIYGAFWAITNQDPETRTKMETKFRTDREFRKYLKKVAYHPEQVGLPKRKKITATPEQPIETPQQPMLPAANPRPPFVSFTL